MGAVKSSKHSSGGRRAWVITPVSGVWSQALTWTRWSMWPQGTCDMSLGKGWEHLLGGRWVGHSLVMG